MIEISRTLYVDGRSPSVIIKEAVYSNRTFELEVLYPQGNLTKFASDIDNGGTTMMTDGVKAGDDEPQQQQTPVPLCSNNETSNQTALGSWNTDLVFYGSDSCYTGDDSLHAMSMNVYLTDELIAKAGSKQKAVTFMEALIANGNVILKLQFNFYMVINDFYTAADYTTTHSSISETCGTSIRLQQFTDVPVKTFNTGINYLIAGCNGFLKDSIRGIAYIGGVCGNYNRGVFATYYNTKPSKLAKDLWVYLHELGHMLGGRHPPELSVPFGIMGYQNNGLINGDLRFAQESGNEICAKLKISSCPSDDKKWWVSTGTQSPTGAPSTNPSASPTTKSPTGAPTTRSPNLPPVTLTPSGSPTLPPSPPTFKPTLSPITPTLSPVGSTQSSTTDTLIYVGVGVAVVVILAIVYKLLPSSSIKTKPVDYEVMDDDDLDYSSDDDDDAV